MKKNLLSVIILVLLLVNVVLTAIMMTSVKSASEKTAELVAQIAEAYKLDVSAGAGAGSTTSDVPMEETEVYNLADEMTIPLKVGEDGKQHYCLIKVALSMDKRSDGYSSYGADLATKESLISGVVNDVIGQYTLEEAQANKIMMQEDILKEIQTLFDSDFIFKVTFSDFKVQ